MVIAKLAPALLLLTLSPGVQAQVLVAPTALFTSQEAPFGTLLVANRSQEPQEVEIDFRFGHPASDSAGDVYMAYGDSLAAAAFSMDPWVRAFPRRFALGPGQEQAVRLIVRPPPVVSDGTYWTRLVTTSSGRAAPLANAPEGSTAEVAVRIEQVTALLYRHGRLSTTVAIGEPRVESNAAATRIRVPLERGGNSPFMGRISARVLDAGGAPVAEAQEYFAVYVDLTKRFELPLLAPGDYTLEITVSSTRPDIPREQLLPMADVVRKVAFRVF